MRVFRFIMTLVAIALIAPAVLLAGDQEIAQQIVSQLQEQRQTGKLQGFSIDLEVEEGVVWMSGRVSSSEQQTLALAVAQHTPGVTQVVNDLAIAAPGATTGNPGAKKSDGVITSMSSAISSAIFGGKNDASNVQQVQAQVPVAQQAPAPYSPQVVGSGLPPRAPQQMAATVPSIPRSQGSASSMSGQLPVGYSRQVNYNQVVMEGGGVPGQPCPMYAGSGGGAGAVGLQAARYDHPYMPNYSWPSYAAYPNYAAVTYPKQYSPTAWPYIGPFYPYPQVPLGWRKVTLEWDDGWWMLDFKDRRHSNR